MKKILKDYVYIVLGAFLLSLSVQVFMLPNKITTGGASGIATILYYLLQIDVGVTILVVNIPLFIVAIVKKGWKFSIKSIITTVLFSVFLELLKFQTFFAGTKFDFVISALYGGILLGIALSLIFKAESTSGGTDLLANILKDKVKMNISKIIFILDFIIIICLMITFKDINIGLYSIIAIFVSTKVIDIIFEGVNYTKVVNIITSNDDKIPNDILTILQRGATINKVIGAYTREEHIIITCIVKLPEITKLKDIVHAIDPDAIMYITNAYEVVGNGFKKF